MKQRFKQLGQQQVFIRFMLPYLMFIVIALALGWLFYNQSYSVVKAEVTRNNMQLLEQVRGTLDSRMSEINRISLQLLNDPKVYSFQRVKDPFHNTNTYKVLETQKSLYSYSASNSFVLDYYLIFKNSNLALSPNSTYELPHFYRHVLSYEGEDYESWRNDLFGTYRNREVMATGKARYFGQNYDMVTYVQSLGYPDRLQGALIVLVDNSSLQALLGGIDISDGGWVSIFDQEGRRVSSLSRSGEPLADEIALDYPGEAGIIDSSQRTDGMMITYTTSSNNGWSYVVAQPPHVVLSKVISLKKLTFSIVAVFLVVGVLLAYLFARRSGLPLTHIISTLHERQNPGVVARRPKDMYGFIQHSLSSLLDKHAELKDQIELQAPLLRETLYHRLLNGDFTNEQEILSLLKHQGIAWNGQHYAIGILHFTGVGQGVSADELQQLDVERVHITEALLHILEDGRRLHHLAEDKIAILFVDEAGDRAEFRMAIAEQVTGMAMAAAERAQLGLHFAIGGFRESLMDVAGSYEEARQCLSAVIYEEEYNVIWYADLPNEHSGFAFPPETENRLINYTKAGEVQELQNVLAGLYQANFVERHLPLAMQQLFLYEVVSCLVKVQDQLMLESTVDIRPFIESDNPKLAFQQVSERLEAICTEVNRRKKSRNVQLIEDVVAMIHREFNQPHLSLDTVAAEMQISKGYLSQFFKEQTGVSFSDYLETLRMNEAKRMLADTRLTIRDIADQVGYYSSSTFCRAFKRNSGISATAFRDLADKEATQATLHG